MKQFTRTTIAASIAIICTSAMAVLPTEMDANADAMKQIGATAAWARGYTGLGSRIGFVDTGADLTNKDLSNVILAKSPYYKSMVDVNRGHGTEMISIAAGAKNGTGMVGVAYNSSVIAYAGGIGGFLLYSDIANGIKWNADNKADVINLSLGGALTKPWFNAYYTNPAPGVYVRNYGVVDAYAATTLMPSLQYATGKGSIIVMAAGNDGNPVPTSPANLAVATDKAGNLMLGGRAVIVGAVDKNNVIASFSNQAGNICQTFTAGVCQDKIQVKDYFLVAPGGGLIWGANANNTETPIAQDVGTSVSAAFVSGGVAVIKQAWPTLRPEQIVQILLKTATDLGAPGVDVVYGNGLMNLDAATKPIGTLALAKITSVSTTQIAAGPVQLSSSGMIGGIISKQSFAGSSVMQNTQVVDSTGRNFTVNMAGGVSNTMQNYSPATAYSGLSQTKLNYVDFGYGGPIGAMYNSINMSGARFGHQFTDIYVAVEAGSAKETNSILGSHGAGAFAVGDSTTTWNAVHLAKSVSDNNVLFGSVAQGRTNGNASKDSLITGFSELITRSWSLGVQHNGVFDNKDGVSFQVTEMPRVVKGSATVTAVTGYATSDVTDNGATATPITSTEKVSLVSNYRQYATSISYKRNLTQLSTLQVNLAVQTDNAGSTVLPMAFVGYTQRF